VVRLERERERDRERELERDREIERETERERAYKTLGWCTRGAVTAGKGAGRRRQRRPVVGADVRDGDGGGERESKRVE